MERVAVIGLGGMGSAMARRLLGTGVDVSVWNRTASKADQLGARVASSAAEAVSDAGVVITSLSDDAALRDVAFGEEGLAAALEAGQTLIEMSTLGVGPITALAAALRPGVAVVEAPVLGSLGEVESGSLTIFAAGDDAAIERVRPVLDVLGTTLSVGPLGSAAGAKLVANHALLALVVSLGEAICLADVVGLPRETTWEILAKTPLAAQAVRRRAAVEQRSFPPRFPLRLALKDARLIVDASSEDELWIAEAVARWLEVASRAGYADGDYTAVLDVILTTARSHGDGNRSAT